MPVLRRTWNLFAVLVAAALLAGTPGAEPVAAQERGAVVSGASKLFVRRGPGMSFPPFARLSEGSIVQVKGQQGQWVRIQTSGGQVGYVHGKYLVMLDRDPLPLVGAAAEATAEPPTPGDQPSAAATTVVEPTIQPATEPQPDATIESEPAEAIMSAAAAPTVWQPPATPERSTMAAERAAIAEEVRRLAAAVAALQQRIEENEPIANGFVASDADADGSVSGGAILLGLLGVGVGLYLGGRYGRAQERGRRSRIRF